MSSSNCTDEKCVANDDCDRMKIVQYLAFLDSVEYTVKVSCSINLYVSGILNKISL